MNESGADFDGFTWFCEILLARMLQILCVRT